MSNHYLSKAKAAEDALHETLAITLNKLRSRILIDHRKGGYELQQQPTEKNCTLKNFS